MQACRAIVPRVFSQHRGIFPNLQGMYTLDTALQNAPLHVKIRAMRVQLEFLQSLDAAPMFGILPMDGDDMHRDIGASYVAPTRAHTGILQMDGGFGASNVDPTRDATLHPTAAAAPRPAAAGRLMHTKATASSAATKQCAPQRNPAPALARPPPAASSFTVPPMPAFFGKGRHYKGKVAVDPQEYWAFTFRTLRERGKAIGSKEIAQAFTQHLVSNGRPAPEGHKSWWSRDRVLMLQMFEMAGVPIDKHLRFCLQMFWKTSSREVLAWLTDWLKSGAAASLPKETLLTEAVKYIRSAQKPDSWWPVHDMELDTWCLATGVVTEERLLEEWTASNCSDAPQHTFFEAELALPVRLSVPARRSLNRFIADGAHRTGLVRGAVRAREADYKTTHRTTSKQRMSKPKSATPPPPLPPQNKTTQRTTLWTMSKPSSIIP